MQRVADAKTPSADVVSRLEERGVRGVLLQMAKGGQIIELKCEMPKCYCPKGRRHFDPKSHPPKDWDRSPDHYPRLKPDDGRLEPANVRIAHILCNREDYGSRMRIRRMLEKEISLEEIADRLNSQGVRRPHGSQSWTATSMRKAYVS